MQQARYDAVADFYAQFAPDVYDDPPMAALLRLIGAVRDQSLLNSGRPQARPIAC